MSSENGAGRGRGSGHCRLSAVGTAEEDAQRRQTNTANVKQTQDVTTGDLPVIHSGHPGEQLLLTLGLRKSSKNRWHLKGTMKDGQNNSRGSLGRRGKEGGGFRKKDSPWQGPGSSGAPDQDTVAMSTPSS